VKSFSVDALVFRHNCFKITGDAHTGLAYCQCQCQRQPQRCSPRSVHGIYVPVLCRYSSRFACVKWECGFRKRRFLFRSL